MTPALASHVRLQIEPTTDYADETILPWGRPTNVTSDALDEAKAILPSYDAWLAPCPPQHLAARVTAMLGHYYVPDHNPAHIECILRDWIGDLAMYPEWAIEHAIAAWRRSETKRPGIAHIRAHCQRLTRRPTEIRRRIRALIAMGNIGGGA